ncbi:AEC family transporter [Fervidicoccus fontis]|uniref:Transporter n=1 Tax=Fervidicoccus fontis TaxID=683846 RepID=A0A7C2ZE25_9CREN|nr:AEC family transporter [Fervidicoccus fontis]HEW64310.1 hypothetical protein [Fervidicoccus fontis]
MAFDLVPVLESIALLFAIMFAGFFYKRLFINYNWYPTTAKILFNIVYWVLTPLTFINNFSESGIMSVLIFPFVAITTFVLIAGVIICKMSFKDKETKYVVLINSVNQNNLFIGYPVLYSAFRNATMSLYFGLISFIYAILIPDIIGSGKVLSKRIILNPVILGFFMGNVIHYATPYIASNIPILLFWAPKALVYLSIFVMGMQLTFGTDIFRESFRKAFYVMAFMRFVLNPIVYLPYIYIFHISQLYMYETILLGIMPPATLNTIMALKYNWHPNFTASSTLILTIISLILATILIMLFGII